MTRILHLPRLLLLSTLLLGGAVQAADPGFSPLQDPLRAVLLESKDKNRGVTVHAGGNNISLVVTALDDRYVIGRSQTTSRIVIRLDRIDGVSAMF